MRAKPSSQKSSLKGKLVVITRSVESNKPWIKYLKKQGAIPYPFPTIEIVPTKLTSEIKNVLKNIDDFDWVVFTSAAGIRSLKELIKKLATEKSAIKISSARMPKIAVVGDTTAKAVRTAGYRVAFKPSTPSSAALAFELEPVRSRSILLLRTSIAPPDMRNVLIERGANVTELPIYTTVLRRDSDPKFEKLLMDGRIDFLTFASPSAVRGFFQRLSSLRSAGRPYARTKLIARARTVPAMAIGPSVVTALTKAGFKDIRTAKEPTIQACFDR
jgi:uroporphyrinogen-III synthase